MSSEDEPNPLLGQDRFHHPFQWAYGEPDDADAIFQPRTMLELTMYEVSSTIRQKDKWWNKFRDENIRSKWIKEIREQEEAEEIPVYHRLKDSMFKYIFAELEDHVKMMNENRGIQLGPYDRTWFADSLVPADVADRLVTAVRPLEDVPEEEKDWHPGSNGQVLDLVHPSICPLVYGKTFGIQEFPTGEEVYEVFEPSIDEDVSKDFISERFQWLPSDFKISQEGKVKLTSSYINNIHPKHHESLAEVIERVMEEAAIPLWERVLSDLRWTTRPLRIKGDPTAPDCIWTEWQNGDHEHEGWNEFQPHPPEGTEGISSISDVREWQLEHPEMMTLPDCPEYDGDLLKFFSSQQRVNLKGRTLQVIVKLANIILTPEKPEYPGGKWHVEGMNNEHIVSTFIYYYRSDNIEDTKLNFRQASAEPYYHSQDDSACMQALFAYEKQEPCVQDVGNIVTKRDRCLAFPNLYQHQVSPFKLLDPTKPGYRKILVFFLVDPTDIIPSATDVPPQQLEIHKYHLRNPGPNSRLSRLPLEILDYIAYLTPGVIDRKEAEAIREELMSERTVFVEAIDGEFFGHEFNMCEH